MSKKPFSGSYQPTLDDFDDDFEPGPSILSLTAQMSATSISDAQKSTSAGKIDGTPTSSLRPAVTPTASNAGNPGSATSVGGSKDERRNSVVSHPDLHRDSHTQTFLRDLCRGTQRFSLFKTFQMVMSKVGNETPRPGKTEWLASAVLKATEILYGSMRWDQHDLRSRAHYMLAVARDIATYSEQPNTRYSSMLNVQLARASEDWKKNHPEAEHSPGRDDLLGAVHDEFQRKAAAALFCAIVSQAGPRCLQLEGTIATFLDARSGPNNPTYPIHAYTVTTILTYLENLPPHLKFAVDTVTLINTPRVHHLNGISLDVGSYLDFWELSGLEVISPADLNSVRVSLLARSEPTDVEWRAIWADRKKRPFPHSS